VYGGYDVVENQSYEGGGTVQSVHEMAPVIGQGHFVDMSVLRGHDLGPEDGITSDDLDFWFEDRAAPNPGSVILLRTGWDRHWGDNSAFLGTQSGAPGVTLSAAKWLTERGVIATGTD